MFFLISIYTIGYFSIALVLSRRNLASGGVYTSYLLCIFLSYSYLFYSTNFFLYFKWYYRIPFPTPFFSLKDTNYLYSALPCIVSNKRCVYIYPNNTLFSLLSPTY